MKTRVIHDGAGYSVQGLKRGLFGERWVFVTDFDAIYWTKSEVAAIELAKKFSQDGVIVAEFGNG